MSAARLPIALIRASHPEPGAAVTFGATLLAVSTGRDAAGVVAVAAAVAASQLAVGWHNDWLDADRDTAVGRRDKPIVAAQVSRRTVGLAAVVAAVVAVPLALLSGGWAGLVAAVALLSSLAYNWPLKFTPLSAVPYAISFAALPAFVVLGLPGPPPPPWWLVAAGATLGGGAHFANVLPDLDHDARTGVRGLPHRLGPGWSTAVAATLLAGASGLLVFGPPGPPSRLALAGLGLALAVLVVGGSAQRRWPARRWAFRAVIVAALIDVALLLTAGALR
ncbi:MAG TPA: UbiA family prenyltransferase [Micromonosporaceae bacterium]